MWRQIHLWFWVVIVAGLAAASSAAVAQTNTGSWSAPSSIAVSRAGGLPSVQHAFGSSQNIDCTFLTYRKAASDKMSTGCFSRSSLGLMDIDEQLVIYNGSDEAYPLYGPSASQTLMPWPNTGRLVSTNNVATGGARLGVYLNPQTQLRDNRQGLVLVSKTLTGTLDRSFINNRGNPIDINPVSLAFSRNGDWLVAETLSGAFVRINRDTLEMMPFAPWYGITNIDHMSDSRVAISDDGRFVAIYSQENDHFKVYDLSACGASLNPQLSLPALNCVFYNYWSVVQEQFGGGANIKTLRFLSNGLLSFEVIDVKDQSQIGVYTLSPSGQSGHTIDYLALGDSYTSGEGAFDYVAGTDTGSNKCHLSAWSYPFMLVTGSHSVACSGAVIADIGSTNSQYRGQVKGSGTVGSLSREFIDSLLVNYAPGYIPQHYFAEHYQPKTLTVSIGGNDIGFGDIIKRCVIVHLNPSNSCYSSYEDRLEILKLINRKISALTDLYAQLKSEVPGVRLYAIGYPEVADPNGNCADNVHLDRSELEFSRQIIRYLDDSIRYAAAKAAVSYIDISKALYGHRLCETDSSQVAVNGLTAGNDAGPIGHESYHPNALGHSLIARSILSQTNDFSLQAQDSTISTPDGADILAATPKTNRPIYSLTPVQTAATVNDTNLDIKLAGMEIGMRPDTKYSVTLDGPQGVLLAFGTTNSWGELDILTSLPSSISGDHFIDITGPGEGDVTLDISQSIYVPLSSASLTIKIEGLYVSG